MDPQQQLMDKFVKISFETDNSSPDGIYDDWSKHGSAKVPIVPLYFKNALAKHYPNHSIVSASPYSFQILGFPDALIQPIPNSEFDTVLSFIPFARRDREGGALVQDVRFGGFNVAWKDVDLIFYAIQWPFGFSYDQQYFVLHEGPEAIPLSFLASVGTWAAQLHEEVLVFNQGFWQKDHGLWKEIQKSSWKDVILREDFKLAIQKDISRFFESEAVYKDLAVPWKRGLIFHGPAGNGKTISLKAAMKGTDNPILYVRSLQSFGGEEYAIQQIFSMARRFAPCLLVFEDLDSHINDRNRSYFLNQLDGLDNNDGLLLIATTNHLERLDGSLSNRPSRFDRKYLFDDPDEHERRLYCGYWQRKLKSKERAPFPDELAAEIAKMTEGFSFAYLKEAFVSTLIHMAGNNDAEFEETLKEQVRVLKKQLDEKPRDELRARAVPPHPVIPPTREQMAEWERNKREKGYFPFDLDKVQVGGPRSKSWAVRSWINGSFQ